MYGRSTIYYLGSIKIMGACCVGKVHNMLSFLVSDNENIILRGYDTHCATFVVLR